ncbi:CPBP family glutamic-type intramembrane protease [Porphyromonas levii]
MLVRFSGIQLPSSQNLDPPQSVFDYAIVILITPLIETALFQALPYYLLSKIDFFRKRMWLIIMTTGLVFALLHFYSMVYVIFAFFPGILLVFGYHLRQGNHPLASIYTVHLLINATPLVYELIFTT